MRVLSLTIVAGAMLTAAAYAAGPGWNGPGWYVVMDSPVKNQALYRGAYKTQDDCMAAKPADKGALQYECVYEDHEPLDN
jgi:hypothetical protein